MGDDFDSYNNDETDYTASLDRFENMLKANEAYFFDVEEQFYISSPAVAFHILCPILELFHHNTTKGFHGMILDKCCDYIQSLFQNCIFLDKDRQKFSIL